jgi:Fe-S-cluster containining protein
MTDFVQISRQPKIRDVDFFPIANQMYERIWQRLMPPQLLTENLSGKVANNVVTPADAPVPDCMTCGACCATMVCVGVRPGENVAPEHCWDIVKEMDDGEIVVDRYLRRDGETLICSALDVGEAAVACTIYETRPQMCRDFEAGSDRCHALRRATGVEPFLSLEEMSLAMEKLDGRPANMNSSNVIRSAEIKYDAESGRHQITALMRDGTLNQIHDYDPDVETYFQFELDGLSLEAANRLFESRKTGDGPSDC